jgi:hypothetical protein
VAPEPSAIGKLPVLARKPAAEGRSGPRDRIVLRERSKRAAAKDGCLPYAVERSSRPILVRQIRKAVICQLAVEVILRLPRCCGQAMFAANFSVRQEAEGNMDNDFLGGYEAKRCARIIHIG